MRAFNAFTSLVMYAVICGAVVTALSPPLLFGEGQGDGLLNPVRVLLPREPRKLYVLFGQIFDLAVGNELRHFLPERRSPHHPVSSRRQDVETLHRLVDDRQMVRRIVDGSRPRPRYRQAPERRVSGLPVRSHPLVVVPVEVDLIASRLVGLVDGVTHAEQDTLLLPRPPSVNYPLRLERAARTLDRVPPAPLLDTRHLAHLEEVNRIIEEHRRCGIAGRHRRMDVPVVRRVRGPHKAVPVQVGKASSALLGLYPLVLDPRLPAHLDQPQEASFLFVRLSDDVVPRLPKTGVEA